MTTPETDPPSGSLRLTYAYEGDSVRLVSRQRVDVVVTDVGLDAQPSFVARHVVEVRDADGTTLARIPVHGDLGATMEVFGIPGEAIRRIQDPNPSGAFTVVVPVPPGTARAVLQRLAVPPPAAAGISERARSAPAAVVLSDDAIEGDRS